MVLRARCILAPSAGRRISSDFQALIWRSSSFLFCRRVGHFLPPVGWVERASLFGPPKINAYRDLILDRFWTDFETNSGPILNRILDRFWIDLGINSGWIFERF